MKVARHPTDAYLSSPCSAIALYQWMHRDRPATTRMGVLDPFAGAGSLLRWFNVFGAATTYAIELDPRWEDELRAGGHAHVRCPADAFDCGWSIDDGAREVTPMVVTNPPYQRVPEAVERAIAHARQAVTWSWLLLREDWFSHGGRPVPDWYLKLRWRPSMGMTTDKAGRRRPGTDRFTGYVWAGWGPFKQETRMAFLDRPVVSAEHVAEHRRLLERADGFREAAA